MNANRSPAPMFNSLVNNVNSTINRMNNGTSTATTSSKLIAWLPVIIALLVFITIAVLIFVYWINISNTLRNWSNSISLYFSGNKVKVNISEEPSQPPPPPPPPPPPQDTQYNQLVENTLPERRQVFNISENRYTFYDAEPLCKALGAEIATYEQVKEAYDKGGDWCNYGWTAGQMALYPTQDSTYQKLQSGPEQQRTTCGKVGINGGYFDNPELRFGVNCYGSKPSQTNNDASLVSNNNNYPETPDMIEFDKKVAKYKSLAANIGILPFSNGKWSE